LALEDLWVFQAVASGKSYQIARNSPLSHHSIERPQSITGNYLELTSNPQPPSGSTRSLLAPKILVLIRSFDSDL
jgi:hypothetical protein